MLTVVKATFEVRSGELVLADEQTPVFVVDVPHEARDGCNEASIRYPSDASVVKQGLDLVIVGEAIARGRAVPFVDESVKILDRLLSLRVHGERRFDDVLVPGSPAPFVRMPIVYERAFGGVSRDGERVELRNPVGCGMDPSPGALAPQIEPLAPLPGGHAIPGLGAIASHWSPRREYAGTFDEIWKTTRLPLMPQDFDVRFNSAAHPSLRFEALDDGEALAITGMTESNVWSVRLRLPRVFLTARYDHETLESMARADTIVVEPLANRVTVTLRHAFRLGRGKKMLREVRVNDG